MRVKIAVIAAATVMASALTASAVLVTYTVDGWGATSFPGTAADTPAAAPPNVPAGDYPPDGHYWGANGYPGDRVELQTYTSTLDLTPGTTIQKINTRAWTGYYTYAGNGNPLDPNQGWQQLWFHFGTARNITIGTATATLNQGGLLEGLWADDYLSFSAGATVSLYVQGYRVDVTPLTVARTGAGWSGPVDINGVPLPTQEMDAQFVVTAVPEPTTMVAGALLLLPFGASTLRMLRRRQVV